MTISTLALVACAMQPSAHSPRSLTIPNAARLVGKAILSSKTGLGPKVVPLERHIVRQIEGVIARVSWPKSATRREVALVERGLSSLGRDQLAPAGVALVLAAWDRSLGRRQVVLRDSVLSCLDHESKLLQGEPGKYGSFVADDWPWRMDSAGRWELRPIGRVPWFGNSVFSASGYLSNWAEADRAVH